MKKKVFYIIILIAGFLMGFSFQHQPINWQPRLPYREFFKVERGTDSPIENIWIKNNQLYVITEDGNRDVIYLGWHK